MALTLLALMLQVGSTVPPGELVLAAPMVRTAATVAAVVAVRHENTVKVPAGVVRP